MKFILSLYALLAATLLPGAALAYIGPGAGLSALGTIAAVIGAFLLLIVGFVWYPVKRLLRRGRPAVDRNAASSEPDR